MRKKLVGTLLIAAMTASTLAGCGSSEKAEDTSKSQQALLHPAVQLKPARQSLQQKLKAQMQQMAKKFLLYGAGIQPSMYMQ